MQTRQLVLAALMIAVLAVAGQFSIPLPFLPAPITLQTAVVMMAGGLLGARLGALSMLAFVVLVAMGAPLLNKLSGGLGDLLGPTGGFVLSWPLAALVIGFFVERSGDNLKVWKVFLANVLGGIVLVYLIGSPWMAFTIDKPVLTGFALSLAFIPGDLLKALLAARFIVWLRRILTLNPTANPDL